MDELMLFWESLEGNQVLFVLLAVFFLWHVVRMAYRCSLLRAGKRQPVKRKEEGVSVIITCSNRAELLRQNLEAFLRQNYPRFEVIVVDECSEDETQEVLLKFQKKYPHLKVSRIPSATKFRCTKKIAINIGILAAKYDMLLFSEIYCRPSGMGWIRAMQAAFDSRTAVVLGFANYEDKKGAGTKRYFRFLRFWRMVDLVHAGMYVMGNGCNMGYRKSYYLEERGFSGNTQAYIGFDTEMVKKLSKRGKVKVVKEHEAHMVIMDDSKKAWGDDLSYFYATMSKWPARAVWWASMDFVVEMLLYLLIFYFIVQNPYRLYFSWLVVFMCVYNLIIINLGQKRLHQMKLFLPSLRSTTCGFIQKWYHNLCSIFTSRKWK